MRKIAITGASGMLGTALLDSLAHQYHIVATSRTQGYCRTNVVWHPFDLLDQEKLTAWLEQERPDIVIQNAALVNVDACEKDEVGAHALHAHTTAIIVNTIKKWHGKLIYISTDCVFDGKKEGLYTEDDQTNPLSIYGKTKQAGELITLAYSNGIVLRTNIFGWSRADRYSFGEWVLKGLVENSTLTMFTDVYFTPIHVTHVAQIISHILDADLQGLFHLAGDTLLSKYDFAIKLANQFKLSTDHIIPISVDDAGLLASRPKNMSLSCEKLASLLNNKTPMVDEGIHLFKEQYDNGWLSQIKARPIAPAYYFWR